MADPASVGPAGAGQPAAGPPVSANGAAQAVVPAHLHARADDDGRSSHGHSDAIDQILENYNFICHPELRLKFKQQLRGCSMSLALAKPWHHVPRVRIMMKPSPEGGISRVIHKVLAVPTHGLVCAYSSKIPLWVLRLQFMASYNWITRQPTLDYRITTKWSDGTRLKRKETYHLRDAAVVRAKWSLDMQLPDLEGHLGPDHLEPADALDVDYGRIDFEVSQVDLVLLSPWGRSKHAEAQLSPAPSDASTSVAGTPDTAPTATAAAPAPTPSTSAPQAKGRRRGGWRGKGREGKEEENVSSVAPTAAPPPAVPRGRRGRKADKQAGTAAGAASAQLPAGSAPASPSGQGGSAGATSAALVPAVKAAGNAPPMPDWLLNLLTNMSVKPPAPHGT